MNSEAVLLVEDNQILRQGLQEILELEGYTVHPAANGREALDCVNRALPDLILSDISMPEMDGFAFFKAFRNHPEWTAIPFIFLTARGDRDDILMGKDLGADDYLIKPLTREELLTAVRARLARSRQLQIAQLQQAYETSLAVLANAIEVRDQYTRGHVERVTAFSILLAEQLGWQGQQIEQLRIGAILHDIGKIHISETILNKNEELSVEEWVVIQQHTLTGTEMIKDIPYLAPAIPVIRHHHERWDGAGYPDQLTGENIPLSARIVSVADGFDAMTTTRPYRPARTLSEAYQAILSEAGSQYDPLVVRAFHNLWMADRIQSVMSGSHPFSPLLFAA
jgi:putative two-component system response regulator